MRNERGGVLPGIIIAVVLLLVLGPILYNFTSGDAREVPDLKIPDAAGTTCVEDKRYMKENHMQLLYDWRETVVREGNRKYQSLAYPDAEPFDMSLSNTCLSCHSNKSEFCDQCHTYLKVKPYCWDCHIIRELPKEGA